MREPFYKKGQRVRLVEMPNDPFPIESGAEGTVLSSDLFDFGDGPFEQVVIRWDNGRSLTAIVPPDRLVIVS